MFSQKINILFFACLIFINSCSNDASPTAASSSTVDTAENVDKDYYTEQHRGQFHFTPETSWMNDPNGMVYHDGEYHLFYQYYPDSIVWGPMHWGHAISEDLVHWEHLPIALYPDDLGYIFSGSAVIDHNNTSGLGENGQDPMIAIFTHHNMAGEKAKTNKFQTQSIAYSNDKGRTWTKYKNNPVISNPGIKDFRDPKVIWHEDSKKWVMIFAAYDKALIYNSPDLISWTLQSEFGIPGDTRLWECPDLFPMKVEGTGETRWVLITSIQKEGPNGGTATSYFVGDFDGKKFIGDIKDQQWLDYGKDNYALVTWANVPASDGRVLALGWMSNWQYAQVVPTQKWRSAMTISRELTLRKVGAEYIVYSNPVRELKQLETKREALKAAKLKSGTSVAFDTKTSVAKVNITATRPSSGSFSLKISNDANEYISVGYDGISQQYFIDRTQSGPSAFSEDFAGLHFAGAYDSVEDIDMEIFIDASSIELFADGGRTSMTDIFFPTTPFTKFEIVARKGELDLKSAELVQLKSIWQK